MGKKSFKTKLIIKRKRLRRKKLKLREQMLRMLSEDSRLFNGVDSSARNAGSNDNPVRSKFSSLLKPYSAVETGLVFAALLLNPSYQSSQYRLEKAIGLCLSMCEGNKKPNQDLITKIFEYLEDHGFTNMEDPAEDVQIDSVWYEGKQYKVCTGLWEGAAYQTQIFLDAIEMVSAMDGIDSLKETIRCTLIASDQIVTKNKLEAYKLGSAYPLESVDQESIRNIEGLIESLKIVPHHSSCPVPQLNETEFASIYKMELGASNLEARPFVKHRGSYYCMLPTAILICVKRTIIDFFRANRQEDAMDSGFFKAYASKIHKTKLLSKFEEIPVQFRQVVTAEGWRSSETIIQFNKNYFYHFMFVGETLKNLDGNWFNAMPTSPDNISDFIDASIRKAKQYALGKLGGKKGCSIIVICGHGKGIGLGSNFESDSRWMMQFLSAHDLDTISRDIDLTPNKFWRIVESDNQLKSMGTRLMNFNGFLNLYGYAKNNDYALIAHEQFQESVADPRAVLLAIPTNCQVDLREKVLADTQQCLVEHPSRGGLRVTRGFLDSTFEENERYDIYCPIEIDRTAFRLVYIHGNSQLWVEQKIDCSKEFGLQFQLYEAAISWLKRMFSELTKEGYESQNSIKLWILDFDIPDDWNNNKSTKSLKDRYKNHFSDDVLTTSFTRDLIYELNNEDNIAERIMISSFVEFVAKDKSISQINELVTRIVRNESAKHIHIFAAQGYRDVFGLDREEPITIERTDEHNIKFNLGWEFRNREKGNLVEGKEECKEYLNQLVGSLWEKIRPRLIEIDRGHLIQRLLSNIEVAEHQKRRWMRTFKANMALQANQENVQTVVHHKLGLYNAATLASRLVVEMAICVSPQSGGREAGILDIQELLCFASAMHHYGGLSEAINYEAIEPKIIISTFGDILFNHEFHDKVLQSYSSSVTRKQLSAQAANYSENMKSPESVTSVEGLFEDQFIIGWKAEFGFSIDEIRAFIDKVEDIGYEKQSLVYKIDREELNASIGNLSPEVIERILKELTLYPRENWTDIPSPFKKGDWQPWNFRRRFSLAFRPLIRESDSRYILAPQLIRDSFAYLLRSCHSAALDENHFSSKEMRQWIGSYRSENGLIFNSQVAEKLRQMGWHTREEIKLSEVLNKKLPDHGDIDVLAWNPLTNAVAVIECKDLDFAKTQGEIARQVYEFKGQINTKGKKDRLLKHIARMEVIRKDLNGVSKFTGLHDDASVKGYVVFSNIVPMVFDQSRSDKENIEFLTFENLEQIFSTGR